MQRDADSYWLWCSIFSGYQSKYLPTHNVPALGPVDWLRIGHVVARMR
jgi:hypothetical protein